MNVGARALRFTCTVPPCTAPPPARAAAIAAATRSGSQSPDRAQRAPKAHAASLVAKRIFFVGRSVETQSQQQRTHATTI
jgi:hypothetical protein